MKHITINLKPTKKQYRAYELLLDKVSRFILFGGGAEGGKSWLGAEWLLYMCYVYPGTKWFIGRNELKRLMSSSFQTFKKVCANHEVPESDWKLNGQYNYIEFVNPDTGKFDGLGSRIDLLDLKYQPSDPQFQRLGSTEYTGGWIEEAGEIHFMAFDVLKSRIGRWRNHEYGLNPAKLLLTCNPEVNWLYRIFYKPWKKSRLKSGYAFVQALYSDNPYTSEEAGARLDEIEDKTLRARLKLGLWEYSADENDLVDYDSIIDLFTNELPETQAVGMDRDRYKKYYTADVARYGSDKITRGSWLGMALMKIKWRQGRGIDQTANDIKEDLRDEMIPYSQCIVDDDGVGGGVVDLVRGVKGFVGNARAIDLEPKGSPTDDGVFTKNNKRRQNFKNLRSQCAFMLAEKIMNHELAIKADIDEATKEMIIEELQVLKKKQTPNEAPLQLISKDEMKEILGRSPDFMDMMSMRMYFDLKKPTVFQQDAEVGGVQPFYEGMPG